MGTALWEREKGWDGLTQERADSALHCSRGRRQVREMLLFIVKGRTNEVTG